MIELLTTAEKNYVLSRLDRAHIAEIAEQVRARLGFHTVVEACYQPGDGTWYSLLFVPLDALVGGKGGDSNDKPPHSYFSDSYFSDGLVVYGQHGTTVEFFTILSDPDYAADQLTDNSASALAIAELLRAVFGS